FIIAAAHIRALTAARRIKLTSPHCRSARQPNPGRRSSYRRGDSVQTTGTSSIIQPKGSALVNAVETLQYVTIAAVPEHSVYKNCNFASSTRPGMTVD